VCVCVCVNQSTGRELGEVDRQKQRNWDVRRNERQRINYSGRSTSLSSSATWHCRRLVHSVHHRGFSSSSSSSISRHGVISAGLCHCRPFLTVVRADINVVERTMDCLRCPVAHAYTPPVRRGIVVVANRNARYTGKQ